MILPNPKYSVLPVLAAVLPYLEKLLNLVASYPTRVSVNDSTSAGIGYTG